MIRFINDYSTGAATEIIQAVAALGGEEYAPYGEDTICAEARDLIRFSLGRSDVDVHFVTGGTQANLTVIAAALRSHEAVLATDWGHIATFETGAVEATGHKVVVVPRCQGKITVAAIERALAFHCDEHSVKPKLVYISQSTEWGSIYTKSELRQLSEFVHANDMWLYIDGARLGAALTSPAADFSLEDIAAWADAFTLGGTKNGALFGEAIVITEPRLKEDFRYTVKQKGGMLAKGWLLGVQFKELFRDGLFYRLAEHSNNQAAKIRQALLANNIPQAVDSATNLLFPILPLEFIMELSQNFSFNIVEKRGVDQGVVRLVTSWATDDAAVAMLCGALSKYPGGYL